MKLTDEQIEAAAKDAYESHGTTWISWEKASIETKNHYYNVVEAAAPYLQTPLEEPTEKEVMECSQIWLKVSSLNDMDTRTALQHFIKLRNAKLLPKRDPLREKIDAVLKKTIYGRGYHADDKKMVDDILAAVRESGDK